MNELATTLFKNLIDDGYKYLTSASSSKLIFTVDNTEFIIYSIKCDYKEKEPITFDLRYSFFSCLGWDVENGDNAIFRIKFNYENFDIKLSRVEFAQYLDKIEGIINRWYNDKMIAAITILDNELEELN